MRLPADEDKYTLAKQKGDLVPLFSEPPIKDFKYWRIVNNRFSHTRIADTNHMIVLKRECKSLMLIKPMEWMELLKIIIDVAHEYDNFAYNLPSMSSVKTIPHAHLYRFKNDYK
jgi:hypothetical protein